MIRSRVLVCWVVFVFVLAAGSMPARCGESVPTTRVVVIRHAEKGKTPKNDPPISAAGQARAALLVNMLRSLDIAAVFTSGFARTDQTGQPVADASEVELTRYDPRHSRTLVETIKGDYTGKSVLVVGHSNTVPSVLDALGVEREEVPVVEDHEYDNLFVVTIRGDQVSLVHLRFGAPTTR